MAPSPPLRIVHTGCAGLRLEIGGSLVVAIDPAEDPGAVDLVLVTWNEAERLQGALEAVRSGHGPRIAAPAPVLDWLAAEGPFEAFELGEPLPELEVEALEYQPVPYATTAEALRKAHSAVSSPLLAARRLATRARLPRCAPVVLRIGLPGARRLVHLNCALHRDTPDAWLRDLTDRWGGADWLLASWDFGEGEAFRERVSSLPAQRLLVTDLVGEVRAHLGLPVEIRSLVADQLAAQGVPVLMLAARTSLRFT